MSVAVAAAACSHSEAASPQHTESPVLAFSRGRTVELRHADGSITEIARLPAGDQPAELAWNDEGTRLAWWSVSKGASTTRVGVYDVATGLSASRDVVATEPDERLLDVAPLGDGLYASTGYGRLLAFEVEGRGGRLTIGPQSTVSLGGDRSVEIEPASGRLLVAAMPSAGTAAGGGPGKILLVDRAGEVEVLADDAALDSDGFTYNSPPGLLRRLPGSRYVYSGTASAGAARCEGAAGLLLRTIDGGGDLEEVTVPSAGVGVSTYVYAVEADSRGRVLVVTGTWPFDCLDRSLEDVPVVYELRDDKLVEIAKGFVWVGSSQRQVAALRATLRKAAGSAYPFPLPHGAELVVGSDLDHTRLVARGVHHAAWSPAPWRDRAR